MSVEFEIASDGRVECEFDGRKRRFRPECCGHTFDEDEIAELVAGNQVEFDAISKAGNPYRAIVSLGEYTFDGRDGQKRTAFGPCLDFDAMNARRNARRGFPAMWCEHRFTDSEKKILEGGGKVHLEDCVSKRTGNTFPCDVIFGEENPGEGKHIIPQFEPRK